MFRARILWSVFAAAAVALALTGSIDRISTEEANASLKRALVTFALSRALNGAISVAQGTELALEPAGVGVVLSVGQILDPINDLVERFSTIMLVAASSIGLQNVLLRITSATGFDLALAGVALWALLSAWAPLHWLRATAPWSRKALLVIIFVRFALPVLVIGSNLVFAIFLEAEQTAALSALEGVQADIEEVNRDQGAPVAPAAENNSLLDRLDDMLDSTLNALDVRAPLEQLQTRVADASEHIISLIVIFVLQTVLLPVGFLWLFMEVLKGIGQRVAGRG